MTAAEFLADAHRHGHRGERMLRRWAMYRNQMRLRHEPKVTLPTLEAAIALEKSIADEIVGIPV